MDLGRRGRLAGGVLVEEAAPTPSALPCGSRVGGDCAEAGAGRSGGCLPMWCLVWQPPSADEAGAQEERSQGWGAKHGSVS
jgi:hypothetical protein